MFKRTATILMLLLSVGIAKAQNNQGYNLLWQISGNGLSQPSYLFGTMHVKDARAFNFSDSVMLALESCEVFALEVHPDSFNAKIFGAMLEGAMDNAMDKIINESFEIEEEAVEEHEAVEGAKGAEEPKMSPLDFGRLISPQVSKKDDKEVFLDAYLYGIAKTKNKEIEGLEEIKTQMDLMQIWRSRRPLNGGEYTNPLTIYNNMITTYAAGNLDAMEKVLSEGFVDDSSMVLRNNTMAESIDAIVKEKSLFSAVGAAHLMGQQSVINLLRAKGYSLKPVSANFTGLSNNYTIDYDKMAWPAHKNDDLGYTINMPSKPISMPFMNLMTVEVCPDLASGTSFMVMTMDMRNSPEPIKAKEMVKNMEANMGERASSVKSSKTFVRDGLSITEVILKKTAYSDYSIRTQLIVKNNMVYMVMVTASDNMIEASYVDRFYESFTCYKPADLSKPSNWIEHDHPDGAYSIFLPSKPKPFNQEVPNPIDLEGDTYKIYGDISFNMPTATNYMITYNDMPNGYYMPSLEAFIAEFEEQLLQMNSEIIGPSDTIWLDGYEGREYTLWLDRKYYSKMRVYVRGNRVYKLLKQNINVKSEIMSDDNFFESFSFKPFLKPSFAEYKSADNSFTMSLFQNTRIDSFKFYGNEIGYDKIYSISSTNPKSGGLYTIEYFDLSEYYKISDKTAYYDEYMDGVKEWSDTLIKADTVYMDGNFGMRYSFENTYTFAKTNCITWLIGNRHFLISYNLSKEEAIGQLPNEIAASFKSLKKTNHFDLSTSKLAKIRTDLSAKDTTIYYKARSAFSYYEFAADDTLILKEILDQTQQGDSIQFNLANRVLSALASVNWSSNSFKKVYRTIKEEEIKLGVLDALVNVKHHKGWAAYVDLILNQTPEQAHSYWLFLSPFSDSLDLVYSNFDKFIKLKDRANYKGEVMSVISRMSLSENLEHQAKINDNLSYIFQDVWVDLDSFLISSELENGRAYNFLPLMYNYLEILKNLDELSYTEKLTLSLVSDKRNANVYLKNTAAVLRISKGLDLGKKIKKGLLKNELTSYETMKAFEKAGKFNEVSTKYYKPIRLGEMALVQYIYNEYEEAKEIKYIGSITRGDSTLQVFSFKLAYYEDQPKNGYIALIGSFVNDGSVPLPYLRVYSPWEGLNTNWEKQAEKLYGDFDKYAY